MGIKQLDEKTLGRVKAIIFLLALIPFIRLVIGGITDGLGANPIEKITRSTGYWMLTLIMVTLTITPLRKLTGWHWLTRTRRLLGLSAFFYVCLHFLTYLVLDQFFDWDSIIKDIIKRPYITIGFPSFLLLIPLAVTSNNAMIKKLGGKRWRCLHRLVYAVAVGGVVHYWWLVKKDLTNPVIFAAVLAVLLGFRLVYWWRGKRVASSP
ncbi:MAG: protein-methionine-sulfoxide reductase heme-binding subunit MsrQ [Methylovulum miyakonense]|uniref:sulfite oxidase heme-binding subunit YedZ n=1 Tax=Methylovulum miyakonense TaxID=645578 RepID=UPI003BB4C8EE